MLAAAFACSSVRAADLESAVQPLAEGVPQVAIARLHTVLAGELSDSERRTATAKLGEALVAAERPEEALELFSEPAIRDLPETKFFQAQALAALSRWPEALPLYQQTVADAASRFRSEALFGQAEATRALGRSDEAVALYRSLERDRRWTTRARLRAVELLLVKPDAKAAARVLDAVQPLSVSERKERRLLRARVEAAQGNPEKAIELLQSVVRKPEGATHSVLIAALLFGADTHLRIGNPEAGDDALEDFVEHHPDDADLATLFAKLDQLYAAERKQSRHELTRWSKERAQPRRAFALWYLARAELRIGRRDLALQVFDQLRAEAPALPVFAEALLEYAQLLQQEQRGDGSIAVLEAARALHPAAPLLERIDLLLGANQYRAEQYAVAAQTFRQMAGPEFTSHTEALYNSTVAWLLAGDEAQFKAGAQDLKEQSAGPEAGGDLALEQGLVAASRGEANAGALLQNFVRAFPKHARASEAWVALAELAFHAAPPRLEEARQNLARAAGSQPTPAASERADYLTIWMEDAATPPNEPKVIELAGQFLEKYPASPFLPDVRLKLAETYYQRQDFASAQTQFELLAQRNANSPIAEKALFFAAQSAARSMGAEALQRALGLFGEVVKKGGELKWAARNEQAVIERKLAKAEDALTLYDEVLRSDAKGAEKREALCGKGDILYELGTKDPENYRRAISLYEQLAEERAASLHWRNQALFKKGMCLEKLQQPAEALAAFYQIVEDESRPGGVREFFWFYKAGFNAARLLEEGSKWQPAAFVYEKLAFAGGGRSEEAKARLNRLRLEHFLWDQ